MIDEPAEDELEAEWADEMLRASIISRLEQLQREGLWSDERRAKYEALLQLTERFPPEYLPPAHSFIRKNRMN